MPGRKRRARASREDASGRLLVFDVGGVLVQWEDGIVMDEVADRLGLPRALLREMLVRFRPSLQSGKMTLGRFWDQIGRAIGKPVPPPLRRRWWERLEERALPSGEVVRWARTVRRRGLATALFSNTDASHRAFFARGWSQGFRPRALSYRLGAAKPDPRAFRRAARMFHTVPSKLWLLDDVAKNVEAARAAGWNASTFRTPAGAERALRHAGWLPPEPLRSSRPAPRARSAPRRVRERGNPLAR